MQAVYALFSDDHVMKLPYFIALSGFVCALFAMSIPHLSALRLWLGVSTVFSLIYVVVAFVLSVKDGKFTSDFAVKIICCLCFIPVMPCTLLDIDR